MMSHPRGPDIITGTTAARDDTDHASATSSSWEGDEDDDDDNVSSQGRSEVLLEEVKCPLQDDDDDDDDDHGSRGRGAPGGDDDKDDDDDAKAPDGGRGGGSSSSPSTAAALAGDPRCHADAPSLPPGGLRRGPSRRSLERQESADALSSVGDVVERASAVQQCLVLGLRSSKPQTHFTVAVALLCVFGTLGVLSLITLRTNTTAETIQLRLSNLDHEFLKVRMQHRTTVHANAMYTCTNGTLRQRYATDPIDPYAKMVEYKRHERRARRRVPALKETRREFKGYQTFYFDMIAVQRRVRDEIDEYGGVYAINPNALGGNTQRATSAQGGGASTNEGDILSLYEDALQEYRNAIDAVRRRTDNSLAALAWCTLAVVAAMFFFATRAWLDAVRQRRASDAESRRKDEVIISKADELNIQRKCLNQFTHELRNKYTPAMHMLETVKTLASRDDVAIPAELRELVSDVTLSIALLGEADQLVTTRLQYHKVFKGNYDSAANVETVDLDLLMRARVDAARALACRDAAVAFRAVKQPPELRDKDVSVRLDMYMFTHISNNLLSNARKHTTSGAVSIEFVGASRAADEARTELLTFAVVDTGYGIKDSVLHRLFREEVASGDSRGVGLGLISCKIFAQAIGGNCWLERTTTCSVDNVGQKTGSEFRFALPGWIVAAVPAASPPAYGTTDRRGAAIAGHASSAAAAAASSSSHHHHAVSSAPSPSGAPRLQGLVGGRPHRMTVYVVEDSALIRKTIIAKLKLVAEQVNNITTADAAASSSSSSSERHDGLWSSSSALHHPWALTFHEHPTVESVLPVLDTFARDPNVLLTVDQNLDSQGGSLRGSDLIRALRRARFAGVIVSASGDQQVADEHLKLGADLALGKPLPTTDVVAELLVDAVAAKQRQHQAAAPRPPAGGGAPTADDVGAPLGAGHDGAVDDV